MKIDHERSKVISLSKPIEPRKSVSNDAKYQLSWYKMQLLGGKKAIFYWSLRQFIKKVGKTFGQ
jgi:hypothetical protein